MRIFTCDEVGQAEREAAARPGMSSLVLLQRAGMAVAQFCLAHFKLKSVCVVCGHGENGGRGLAAGEALRGLAEEVSIIILAKDETQLNPYAAAMLAHLGISPIWLGDEAGFELDAVRQALKADLIVDAIAGCGFQPPLQVIGRKAVEAINDAFGTVVSVDLPSGVDADKLPARANGDMVFAHGIITFVAPKPAHIFGELTSGPIAVSELGVQPVLVPNQIALSVVTGQEVGIAFPPRPADANKGQFGHVLVIAGSLGKAGAASLAGIAALVAGAGLVTVACPRSIQATVAGFAPELMTEGLPETGEGTIALAAGAKVDALLIGKDVVVLGPGLSTRKETAEFVRRLVARCPLPLVLDADGLNAFAGQYSELSPRGDAALFRVLTPHPGEAARLLDLPIQEIQADRVQIAQRLSRDTGSCVALKGSRTVVAGLSRETWINMSGNPALAKSGSGDVLSGIIAAALARHAATTAMKEAAPPVSAHTRTPHQELSDSERLRIYQEQQLKQSSAQLSAFLADLRVAGAVHLHGLAADFARDHLHENTVLAMDLLEHLSEAFHECELQRDHELFYLQR
jgi:NAD(P)H-hydrate epimerase